MNWREHQTQFARAVRDPTQAVPEAVGPRTKAAPTARFNVYRNNGAVSLTEAMADTYPVVAELVGAEFFTGMARAYVGEALPSSPVLLHYGATFPEFIERFEPAGPLPFLSDVARIEWAWLQAYHAADRESITAAALHDVDAERLADMSLVLHPSAHLIVSEWPVVSLWSAHQRDSLEERQQALRAVAQQSECGLIVRPEFEVNVHRIEAPIMTLLKAFQDRAALGGAAEQLAANDAADFGGMLSYVFSTGAVVAIQNS